MNSRYRASNRLARLHAPRNFSGGHTSPAAPLIFAAKLRTIAAHTVLSFSPYVFVHDGLTHHRRRYLSMTFPFEYAENPFGPPGETSARPDSSSDFAV